MMDRMLTAMELLWICCMLAACSPAASRPMPTPTAPPADLPASPTPASTSTSTPSGSSLVDIPPFPACTGMQNLQDPVEFDWPNLKASMEQFIASAWQYYSCDQPPADVIAVYRDRLGKPPYNLWESNWLEREQGTLGIYFSESGLWYYVWFLPQPGDPAKSYIVVAESMASVEC